MPRRSSPIVLVGVAMVAVQLAFRAWALWGSWFYFDDLAFMSRAMNQPLDAGYLLESYGGHLMPAGFALAYLLTDVAAYHWGAWAATLLVLQGLAGIGMLRLLLSMFGRRPAVLALLAVYLAWVFTLPAGVWWAAGINQLPLQVALTFGLTAFLDHLRSRRVAPLVVSLLWVAAGLAFYEKTVLVVGLFALVALGWFSTGNTPQRLRGLWDDYRAAVCAFAVLGGGYLACYAVLGLDFSPGGSADVSWGPIAWNLVGLALLPAAVGGPVVWQPLSVGSLADAPEALLVVSWAVAVGVGYAAHRTRTASKRAWALVGFTLLADVALLASARAGIVGPEIGREYRYQTESAAVLVLALGLAFLPLLGAREQNLPRDQAGPPVPAVDDRRLVAAATAVVVVASLVSSVRYVDLWQDRNPTEAYVSHVARALTGSPQQPVELVDDGVPQTLLWSFRYPENTYSHLFRPWERHYTFPREAVDDELHLVDASGDLVPVRLEPARRAVPPRAATGPACPYPAHDGALRVRLDGPVIGDGWWVTVDYTARTEVPLRLTAGDEVHRVTLPAGRHTGWFQAAGTFRDVVLADVPAAAGLCVRALALGSARPAAGGR